MTTPKKKPYAFLITPSLKSCLEKLKRRDGIPEGEQIRRALGDYFKKMGVKN